MPLPESFICEARQFGERMHCGRCELQFAPETKARQCKQTEKCGLTASVIRAAIEDATEELAVSIDAASRCSIAMRTGNGAPDARLLRREAALRAGVRFIDHYQPDKVPS